MADRRDLDPAPLLAFGILGVVVLNALIGFVQEHATERSAEALQAMVLYAAGNRPRSPPC